MIRKLQEKTKKKRGVSEIDQIIGEVKYILMRDDLTPAERLKAVEVWSKVLMIKHKINDGDKGDASFFADK